MTEPKETDEKTKRAYLLASVVCERLWGGEHGWETASNEEFSTLLANLKKLNVTLAAENAALREKLAEREALLARLCFRDMGCDEDEGTRFTTQEVWQTIHGDRVQDWLDFDDLEAARLALTGGDNAEG